MRSGFRNKSMLLCALAVTATLAAPGAFARDHGYYGGYHDYSRHGWHHDHGNTVGALIAGALIGGVIVNAIDHSSHRTYYPQPYYAPPPPPPGYYYDDGYRGQPYYDNGYNNSGYYNQPTYYGDGGGY